MKWKVAQTCVCVNAASDSRIFPICVMKSCFQVQRTIDLCVACRSLYTCDTFTLDSHAWSYVCHSISEAWQAWPLRQLQKRQRIETAWRWLVPSCCAVPVLSFMAVELPDYNLRRVSTFQEHFSWRLLMLMKKQQHLWPHWWIGITTDFHGDQGHDYLVWAVGRGFSF